MATYKQTTSGTSITEFETYGLSRLGSYKVDEVLTASVAPESNAPANLRFEISDHLGSVRAVVTGVKQGDGFAVRRVLNKSC